MTDSLFVCCVPNCTSESRAARGLCKKCYAAARYAVTKGEVTWDELERLNLAKPKPCRSSKNRIPFFRALETARLADK